MRTAAYTSQFVLVLLLTSGLMGLARPQQQEPSPPPTRERRQDKERPKDAEPDTSWPRTPEMMEQEIQYRAALELRQSERRKAVEAAEEILTLARRLKSSTSGESVNVSETLETIEKLAKRIRSSSGGGGSDEEPENRPSNMEAGADQIIQLAQGLKQQLETLDARVISVTIIDGANAIIQLSGYLRERARSGSL